MSSGLYLQICRIKPPIIAPNVQYVEAGLDVIRFEQTLQQSVPCGGEQLIDRLGPESTGGVRVLVFAVVAYQWLDEMSPHGLVTEQPTLDEMSNE